MNKLLALTAISFLGLAGSANAATLDIFLNSTGGVSFAGISSYNGNAGGSLNPTTNLTNAVGGGSLVLNANSSIVNGTLPCCYKVPSGDLNGAGNAGNYLAVQGAGLATYTLAPNTTSFGFSWGTIDSYNSLLLSDFTGHNYTISGGDILAALTTLSLPHAEGVTNYDVNFIDPNGPIKTAAFSSSVNSFEVGNISERTSATPLPASFPLFAAALLGLAFLAHRRSNARV